MTVTDSLTPRAMEAFAADAKIALVSTVDERGLPHVTLLTSLEARTEDELTWGQFCEGKSKRHVHTNPRAGFLVMSLDKHVWRGTARWSGTEKTGETYDRYNQKPMFRYNAYFGIHTVHVARLMEVEGPQGLSVPALAAGAMVTKGSSLLARPSASLPALNQWTVDLFDGLQTLVFAAVVNEDGYPRIAGPLPAATAGTSRVVVGAAPLLEVTRQGQAVALFAVNLGLESALVRGPFGGLVRRLGPKVGIVDVDWVYNTMPPLHGQIYPPRPLEAVEGF